VTHPCHLLPSVLNCLAAKKKTKLGLLVEELGGLLAKN